MALSSRERHVQSPVSRLSLFASSLSTTKHHQRREEQAIVANTSYLEPAYVSDVSSDAPRPAPDIRNSLAAGGFSTWTPLSLSETVAQPSQLLNFAQSMIGAVYISSSRSFDHASPESC